MLIRKGTVLLLGLLKNRELYRSVWVSGVIAVIASAGAFIWNLYFGIFTLVLCLLLIAAQLYCSYVRYAKLAELSASLDGILHGTSKSLPRSAEEGELAILSDELVKMLCTLNEQKEQSVVEKARLSDFIADISHQIKTPLTSANLLIQRLSAEPDAGERAGLCAQLMSITKKLDALVTSLLKLSRLDARAVVFRRERVDARTLMQNVFDSLKITLELRCQTFSVAGEGGFYGDEMWLEEAMCNIVKNCSEHTPPGGSVSAVIEQSPLYTGITVTDTGAGFEKREAAHIFERFYKGKSSSGFGIGLSLSKTIIEAQNGIITAQNAAGGGAEFEVRFYQ